MDSITSENINHHEQDDGQNILEPSILLQELEIAKQYIKDLEMRLEKRENELRISEQQVKKSFRRKNRRVGILRPSDFQYNVAKNDSGKFIILFKINCRKTTNWSLIFLYRVCRTVFDSLPPCAS